MVQFVRGALWGFAMLAAVPAGVAEAAQSKCLVSKNKCVSGLVAGFLKCHRLAETPGKAPDPNAKACLDKARAKLTGGAEPAKGCFGKLEAKTPNDCLTTGDADTARLAGEACVAQVVEAIDPAPLDQTKCGAGKKKCVAGRIAGVLKCWQSAQTPGKDPSPNAKGCLDKVNLEFDDPAKGCFAKLERKAGNDCQPPIGNAASLKALTDACVADTIARLEGGGSTTSTTSTTTTTSTTIPSSVTCGPQGIDVTATLVYEPRITGEVYGMFVEVGYPTSVSLPGSGTASTVRSRFTNLLGSAYRLTGSDVDTNANGVDDQARALVTAQGSAGIPSAAVERVRFDCTPGAAIAPTVFGCNLASLSDSSGLLFPPEVAALIRCALSFAPAS